MCGMQDAHQLFPNPLQLLTCQHFLIIVNSYNWNSETFFSSECQFPFYGAVGVCANRAPSLHHQLEWRSHQNHRTWKNMQLLKKKVNRTRKITDRFIIWDPHWLKLENDKRIMLDELQLNHISWVLEQHEHEKNEVPLKLVMLSS